MHSHYWHISCCEVVCSNALDVQSSYWSTLVTAAWSYISCRAAEMAAPMRQRRVRDVPAIIPCRELSEVPMGCEVDVLRHNANGSTFRTWCRVVAHIPSSFGSSVVVEVKEEDEDKTYRMQKNQLSLARLEILLLSTHIIHTHRSRSSSAACCGADAPNICNRSRRSGSQPERSARTDGKLSLSTSSRSQVICTILASSLARIYCIVPKAVSHG